MLSKLSQLLLIICFHYVYSYNLDILMPHVAPTVKDTYLCFKYEIKSDKPVYITEFIPQSKKEIAHHMLLFGCDQPGSTEEVWNCGEMHSSNGQDKYKSGPVCGGSGQSIIYAWAMDAPKLVLPEDVAFKVGPDTNVKYMVLQVHYAAVENFINGGTDASGITAVAQDTPVPNVAGVLLLSTGGRIKTGTEDYFESACEMKTNLVLHPFAFRTHSHKLGLVTSGYRVRIDKNTGEQKWTEIGRRSPQLPQMFYPATNQVPIRKGDIVAARCTMKNFVDHDVAIGPTGEDEMCNFYMMYYVEGENILDNNFCSTSGPPYWYFKNFRTSDGARLDLDAIPDTISVIPKSNEKPHNMQNMEPETNNMHHDMTNMDHEMKVESTEKQENYDEDVEYLKLLEEDAVLRHLMDKYLNSK